MHETQLTRILHLEDDAGAARLLKKRLERSNYQVDLAFNGEDGLVSLFRESYAAVIMDYEMPIMGGLELLGRLAKMDQMPPIIMLTGNGSEKVAVEAMKLGAADYMVKDSELAYLELLPMVIEQVLQRQRFLDERENMLSELRESEERYRKLVELSPDGILVHCEGSFQFINPAGAEILGASSREELLGRHILDFVHPDYHQVFTERLGLLEQQSIDLPWLEEKFLRCDGSEVDVEVTALPSNWQGRPGFQTIFRDITERKADEQRLERMAKYDALTSLPNRGFFFDRLNQLVLHSKRDATKFALLFIDLDRFKEVNDRLGHYFGDLLLKEVALRLASCLRESDTVARIGGDEFVVILARISTRFDAAAMAQRISQALRKPFDLQGQECFMGASIGISLYPEDGETRELLLVKVDTAMYLGKKGGREGFQFYSAEESAAQPRARLTRSADAPGSAMDEALATALVS